MDSVQRQHPAGSTTETTPRLVIDPVVRSVCGRGIERLVRLTSGGLNETYRVEIHNHAPVVVRIARRPLPWFTDEAHAMAHARAVGVPTPAVLGVEHVEHDGDMLSFSILQLVSGRSLEALAPELPVPEIERLVMDSGELLARLHSVPGERGMRHELGPPGERVAARAVHVAHKTFGAAAVEVVERGIDHLRDEVISRPVPPRTLSHGDWLPKHLLIDDEGKIASVIDWEFAGPAPPARDLARWEVAAGEGLHDRTDLLRLGYARVTDPDAAAAGWVPAFAIDFALEILSWRNPAPLAQLRRCVDVIPRHTGA